MEINERVINIKLLENGKRNEFKKKSYLHVNRTKMVILNSLEKRYIYMYVIYTYTDTCTYSIYLTVKPFF